MAAQILRLPARRRFIQADGVCLACGHAAVVEATTSVDRSRLACPLCGRPEFAHLDQLDRHERH
jgi:hypothetical protein